MNAHEIQQRLQAAILHIGLAIERLRALETEIAIISGRLEHEGLQRRR